MKDCRVCKHFVWCEWPKIVFYKQSRLNCPEFEERGRKEGRGAKEVKCE